MNISIRNPISILVVASVVVAADVVVMPILHQSLYRQAAAKTILALDFSSVLLTGLAGLFFAARVDSPYWWRPGNSSPASRKVTFITVLLGSAVVVSNTLIFVTSRNQVAQLAPWLIALTRETAIALAFRAALTENIVFRLFLFPLAAWVAGHFIRSRRISLVVGALVSALMFSLIHPGFLVAFLAGLALTFIYYHRGLLSAMTVQFFADAIPFVLLSLL